MVRDKQHWHNYDMLLALAVAAPLVIATVAIVTWAITARTREFPHLSRKAKTPGSCVACGSKVARRVQVWMCEDPETCMHIRALEDQLDSEL